VCKTEYIKIRKKTEYYEVQSIKELNSSYFNEVQMRVYWKHGRGQATRGDLWARVGRRACYEAFHRTSVNPRLLWKQRWISNCVEQSPYWETYSRSASKEISCLLWNPNVHSCVLKSRHCPYPEPDEDIKCRLRYDCALWRSSVNIATNFQVS
jgi:hypothetical protein